MQTRKKSAMESVANFVTAFLLGWLATYYLVPVIWGADSNLTQPIGFVLFLNVLSTARHYFWRRIFNKYD